MLDNIYKWAKIVGIVVGVLVVSGGIVSGIAVSHFRVEALQQAVENASAHRHEIRREVDDLDQELNDVKTTIGRIDTHVIYIKEAVERIEKE